MRKEKLSKILQSFHEEARKVINKKIVPRSQIKEEQLRFEGVRDQVEREMKEGISSILRKVL